MADTTEDEKPVVAAPAEAPTYAALGGLEAVKAAQAAAPMPVGGLEQMKSPVDPSAKWNAYAAGALAKGDFASSMSNALGNYAAQQNEDSRLTAQYIPVMERMNLQRQTAALSQQKQQQAMLSQWGKTLGSAVGTLYGQADVTPEQVVGTIRTAVAQGAVPVAVAQEYLQNLKPIMGNPAKLKDYIDTSFKAANAAQFAKPQTLKPGEQSFIGGQVAAENKNAAPDKDPEFIKIMKAQGIPEGSPEWNQAMAARATYMTTHPLPNQMTVTQTGEKEEAKQSGKALADSYQDYLKGGKAAQDTINNNARFAELVKGIDTGPGQAPWTKIQAGLAEIGLKGQFTDNVVGRKQAAQALSQAMALNLHSQMPGPMSDADRNFLTNMVAGIDKGVVSNKLILETTTRLAQYQRMLTKMAIDYKARNGTFAGFEAVANKYADEVHPFDGLSLPPTDGAAMKNHGSGGRNAAAQAPQGGVQLTNPQIPAPGPQATDPAVRGNTPGGNDGWQIQVVQ